MYSITDYIKQRAQKLGVTVKPSTNPKKKLNVFRDDVKIASCGAITYNDYPTYIAKYGKSYADERRRLYKLRHNNNRTKEGTAGYYADNLLW